jgi:hypothetical protein
MGIGCVTAAGGRLAVGLDEDFVIADGYEDHAGGGGLLKHG